MAICTRRPSNRVLISIKRIAKYEAPIDVAKIVAPMPRIVMAVATA